MLTLALAQINPTVGDLAGNSYLIETNIKAAKIAHADAVVFPELALCGYPPEDLLLKRHFIDANIKALDRIAKKVYGITAIIGFVDSDAKGCFYNAAAIVSEGKVKDVYYKHQLPNYGVFDEKRYFTPGTKRGLVTINGVKCGINICEDIWIDGGVYYQEALAKAKVLINLSSSPYEIDKIKTRESLLVKRAKETGLPIIYVNTVGGQDELVFDGGSMAVNAQGEIIARAKEFAEELVIVNLAQQKNHKVEALLERDNQVYQALVTGTRDYVRKNGFNKVAIGLSGGIDSALVAAIAVDALGRDNVVGISMPTQFNSKSTRLDAAVLARNLGIEFKEIPIKDIFSSYLKTLKKYFAGTTPNAAEENIQARIRGNILMAFSNKFGWLILTTGNKSEMGVGYCTLYGDMSGGFAVIKDVFKTEVYALARWRNTLSKDPIIPKSIILRAPSAELRPNQTDEASLGSYDELDQLLHAYIEEHQDVVGLSEDKKKRAYALKTVSLVDRNEYKRRQSPPGIKVSSRAFGRDWRLPLTNKYQHGV